MPRTWPAAIIALWLSFTGASAARAQEARWSRGAGSVQAGSIAGFSQLRGEEVVAIGSRIGAAFHLGPAALGADWDYMAVGNHPGRRGRLHRVGVTGRLDVARIDPVGGPNTSLALYVDGGVGHQRGTWDDGSSIDRSDFAVGGGWMLVHRVNLSTRPRRLETVGWRFGWRFTAAPRWAASNSLAACRDKNCPPPGADVPYDVGMVVNSSIDFAW